jgi:hypothetical protein
MKALSTYSEKKEKKGKGGDSFATRHLRALITVLRTARMVNAVTTREIDASLSGAPNASLPIDRNQIVQALLSSDDDLRMVGTCCAPLSSNSFMCKQSLMMR